MRHLTEREFDKIWDKHEYCVEKDYQKETYPSQYEIWKDLEKKLKELYPEPKPYSDPSMKEVLEKELPNCDSAWILLNKKWIRVDASSETPSCISISCTFGGLRCSNEERNGLDVKFNSILAAHGYFPDSMFEKDQDSNLKFKY